MVRFFCTDVVDVLVLFAGVVVVAILRHDVDDVADEVALAHAQTLTRGTSCTVCF